jgi:hypothetical protein
MAAPLLAPIVWAQRKASLYFAINLPDVTESKIELSATGLKFSGVSSKKSYVADIEFFGELDTAAEVRSLPPRAAASPRPWPSPSIFPHPLAAYPGAR